LYYVVANFTEVTSKFSVIPGQYDVDLYNKSVVVEPFSVIGFSINGKVLNSLGEGVGGVKILIDG
jgi:hypothetical protein